MERRGCVKKTRKRHAVREMEVDPSEPLCRRSCVKKTRKRHAVREMKVDPSKSLCRKSCVKKTRKRHAVREMKLMHPLIYANPKVWAKTLV